MFAKEVVLMYIKSITVASENLLKQAPLDGPTVNAITVIAQWLSLLVNKSLFAAI